MAKGHRVPVSRRIQEALDASSRIIEAMLARQPDLAQAVLDALQPEAATPQTEAAASAELSTEGAIPSVADGSAAKAGETASEQAFGGKPTAPTGELGAGMFTHAEYRAACTAAGTPEKWDERYSHGHTEARQWINPHEGRYDNVFTLKKNESASQAVKDFLAGPTISDYRVLGVALEMDELRDDLGDHRFDRLFGSRDSDDDATIPVTQRLQITSAMYTVPFRAQMLKIAQDADAVDHQTDEPEAPQVAAGMEQQPQQAGAGSQPAPEMIAEELGIQRDQELV